jgi:hypothetical protein
MIWEWKTKIRFMVIHHSSDYKWFMYTKNFFGSLILLTLVNNSRINFLKTYTPEIKDLWVRFCFLLWLGMSYSQEWDFWQVCSGSEGAFWSTEKGLLGIREIGQGLMRDLEWNFRQYAGFLGEGFRIEKWVC